MAVAEQPSSKMPKPRLDGYKILSLAGTGAKAHIYLAENEAGERFAIKHVLCEDKSGESGVRQVTAEHEVSSKFTHPNLRRSFEIHVRKKWMRVTEVILVMEFVEGEELQNYAKDRELPELVAAFLQAARGLRAMHQAGLVHADLKPQNILVNQAGVVKIIDFGQSCKIGTAKPKRQGTPDYIPYEQYHCMELDPRSDVFSLGATIYQVLTGEPMTTEMNKQLNEHHAAAQVTRKPQRETPWEGVDLPPILLKLIEDCCQNERNNRPRNIGEVIARLELIEASLARRAAAGGGAPAE